MTASSEAALLALSISLVSGQVNGTDTTAISTSLTTIKEIKKFSIQIDSFAWNSVGAKTL